jgi:hypothetical protein
MKNKEKEIEGEESLPQMPLNNGSLLKKNYVVDHI